MLQQSFEDAGAKLAELAEMGALSTANFTPEQLVAYRLLRAAGEPFAAALAQAKRVGSSSARRTRA